MWLETNVAAPPERVFRAVGDFAALSEWDPFARRSALLEGRAMTLGAVYEIASPGGLVLRYEIVEVDAPGHVTYRGGTKRVTSTDTITVTPHDHGSVVSIRSDLTFSGWTRIAGPLIVALVWFGGRFGSLPALRRHLQRQESGSSPR